MEVKTIEEDRSGTDPEDEVTTFDIPNVGDYRDVFQPTRSRKYRNTAYYDWKQHLVTHVFLLSLSKLVHIDFFAQQNIQFTHVFTLSPCNFLSLSLSLRSSSYHHVFASNVGFRTKLLETKNSVFSYRVSMRHARCYVSVTRTPPLPPEAFPEPPEEPGK